MKARHALSSWKSWVGVVAAVAVLWLAGALWSRAGDPDRILAEPRGPNGELTTSQVERLLACSNRDVMNMIRRDRYTSARMPGALNKVIGAIFPDRHTNVKIIHEGRAAAGKLLRIALEQKGWSSSLSAFGALSSIDPYGTIQAFKQPIVSGQAGQGTTLNVWQFCVPRVHVPAFGKLVSAYSPQAFASDLVSKSVDEIFLERVDLAVANAGLMPNDPTVLWWLNRYRGSDFDEWLAANAPDVLAFRKREIERGCDPVRLVGGLWKTGDPGQGIEIDEQLVKSMYPTESDQKAMRDLWRIDRDYKVNSKDGDWHATLTQWYNASRSRLVYDPKVMRFVVGPAPVRPEVDIKIDSTDTGAVR